MDENYCPNDPVQEGTHYFDGAGVCIYCNQPDNSETVTVTTQRCFVCGNRGQVVVPKKGLELWKSGALIQNALPELDADQIELLISGTHAHCWEAMFAGEVD